MGTGIQIHHQWEEGTALFGVVRSLRRLNVGTWSSAVPTASLIRRTRCIWYVIIPERHAMEPSELNGEPSNGGLRRRQDQQEWGGKTVRCFDGDFYPAVWRVEADGKYALFT